MATNDILALVLAGGEGTRLHPLTAERSKPSVPFGGSHRIVDFVISNCINSRIYSVYLLVQYKSQSMIEHVRKAWVLSPILPGHFITIVPPQMREGPEWFQGTADAVYQNLNLVRLHRPGLVAVFGADHIYRMDLRQMAEFHQQVNADITVAALPVPIQQTRAFGVIGADDQGRIVEFQEKPPHPRPMPGDPGRAFASMGNYMFTTRVLLEAMEEAHSLNEKDFGRHVIPRLLKTHRVFAYDFSRNQVPGIKPYEEASYWRDVGTVETYWKAHQDLLGEQPKLDLFNPFWPIRSSHYAGPMVQIIGGGIEDSIIGAGTWTKGRRIRRSVIRQEVVIEEDVEIDECVIMDYVVIKRGSRLRRAIVDRYNVFEEGTVIGYDQEQDRARYFVDEPSGLVVVPRGQRRLNFVY